MDRLQHQLEGIAIGAGLMYLLDPARGARRRAVLRDGAVHWEHRLERGLDAAARDARNRATGMAAVARGRLRRDEAPDAVIQARVRSELGRVVSHPGAIDVFVQEGRVVLQGPVLADEVEDLLACVESVPGVEGVENRLDVHLTAGDIPGLQGPARHPEPRAELVQENWSPAIRLLMGMIGGAMTFRGMRRPGLTGSTLSALGFAILTRAATNLPSRRLVGIDAGRRAVDFHKAINIAAPVEEVWDLWSRFENFPRFMSHVREVRTTGEGRSHWVARGPAGTRFEWDAEITQWVPNELLAWRSVEGATVASTGIVRFQPTADGGTHVDVRMSYNPPAGALGHTVARLFGSDPKRAMDEDLVRLKSLLELGSTSADGETADRGQLQSTHGSTPA